ncbi:MAG: hypothetical protein HOP15_07775 [Planctomycetes bacterium]|nr:hypothetical protein [Planctomycetota bacterium]
MHLRPLWLALLLPLAACSSQPARSEAGDTPARFTYHAALARVPAGATRVRLGVRLPERVPAGALRALSAYGLVGNAPFELVLPDSDSGTLEREHVRLSWQRLAASAGREIVLESRGKALELGLRLTVAVPAGARVDAPYDASALEAELAEETWAEIDARPASGLETRCVRVR